MSALQVTLRDAQFDDCERVWDWNFAPDVRAVSKCPEVVTFSEHTQWFEARIARGEPTWIVEESGVSIGVVRLDAGDPARISIALEPSARGRGVGRRAITQACRRAGGRIVAEIAFANHASRACFEACGFVAIGDRDALVTYHWSP